MVFIQVIIISYRFESCPDYKDKKQWIKNIINGIGKFTDGDRRKVAKVISPDYLIYGEKNNVGDSH